MVGIDAELDGFGCVADGEGIHGGLRGEVRREERRGTATGAGDADQDEQPVALPAQVRQRCAVHPLGAEDVDVVHVREFLRCERLGRAEDHGSGVVDDNVQAARVLDDMADGGVRRFLRADVELDRVRRSTPFCSAKSAVS
jgi:hypothetical protein